MKEEIEWNDIRNVAIIAHVDHGKTTMVDALFRQTLHERKNMQHTERAMDKEDLERERGITILSKNTSIIWKQCRINIIDTPGHADFGGEVERVLSMVDAVLLLVDAVEGPMPQTRFVAKKAIEAGLSPIVVVNKVDRPEGEPDRVIDEVFEMLDELGANEEQLDFPVVYASAVQNQSTLDLDEGLQEGMSVLLDAIIEHAPKPDVDIDGPFQMQVSVLDFDVYKGLIAIGRITRGAVTPNTPVTVISADGSTKQQRILELFVAHGLERRSVEGAHAGDIVSVSGLGEIEVSDTLCDKECVEALPALEVDKPTLQMLFLVNTSPFAGLEGSFLTSRQIRERLLREASHNVALHVEDTEFPDQFSVAGRGELHLSILIEMMRREGYEFSVGRPQVITKEVDGKLHEPFELLVAEIDAEHQGSLMEVLGNMRGQMKDLNQLSANRIRIEYIVATRALLGFRSRFLSLTSGTGIMTHSFSHYGEKVDDSVAGRTQGVLIASHEGQAVGYALFSLQNRGRLYVSPGQKVYEGMIVGLHSRSNDLVVNPLKEKKLTNIRASGSDENILLTPPINVTLEYALQFVEADELIEVTPESIRLRKQLLTANERKRYERSNK